MDVSMPELNGIEGKRQICGEGEHPKVLGLSMHRDPMSAQEILRAGARGYPLKDAEDDKLLRAIRAVSRGESDLSPAVCDAVLQSRLTSREREALTRIAEGFKNKEIAAPLRLSVYTAESHRGRVLEKLNLHDTGEVVRFALRNEVMDQTSPVSSGGRCPGLGPRYRFAGAPRCGAVSLHYSATPPGRRPMPSRYSPNHSRTGSPGSCRPPSRHRTT